MSAADPFLKIDGLTKRFKQSEALRSIDLEVGRDELLVVLGPTGAGKTTLLRTIAGLETPDAGAILMNGADVVHLPPADRDVALVFQNFSLYPDRTVRQNMEFPLRAPGRNLTRQQINERIEWAASVLRITKLLDRKSTRLSGGEMQRVAIGRAIVRRPKLFLMDEPLTNLDAKLRESLRVELLVLRRELKTPVIFVTHDQSEALSMGDRIVVLSEGRILQTGTPREIYRNPVSPQVARQLGQPPINLIPVDARDGRRPALQGVRPEDISLTGGDTQALVKVVEDMGPVLFVLIDWLGQDIHVLAPKGTAIRPDDQVFPRINPDRIIKWDAPA